MATVSKKILVDRIAERSGHTHIVVKQIIQHFLDEVISELGGGSRLEFRDFGVFSVHRHAARIGQNPKTMEKVQIPSRISVKFKPGRSMKRKVQLSRRGGAAATRPRGGKQPGSTREVKSIGFARSQPGR
jgi:integration host factor subunit beta